MPHRLPRLSRRAVLAAAAALPLVPAPARAQPQAAPAVVARKLTLATGEKSFRPEGKPSPVILVEGQSPGPVIRVTKGDMVDLTVENRLDAPTALHIHGLRGANAAEGMPGLAGASAIAPGETRTLRIATPDSGTYLLMPSLQGRVGEQLERGLAGAFIVEEAAPPAVDLDHVALLDDVRAGADGVLDPAFDRRLEQGRVGRLGNVLLVNGRPAPETLPLRPGARIRLRLASIANARVMPMRFENMKATVIALDGQPCDPFDPLKRTVVLLPGSRYDLMLDLPNEAGKEARVMVAIETGFAVVTFKTEGEPLPARPPVAPLAPNDVPASIRLQSAARTELAISGGLERPAAAPGAVIPLPDEAELAKRFPDRLKIWSLNSGFSSGFSGKPLLTVKRGAPVVIALTNRSPWPQVMTVHGHVFRLLHPLDDGWEPYFLDTIHLPPGTTSRIAFDAANPGKWAIRSMIAEHYDAGVATWFEVQ